MLNRHHPVQPVQVSHSPVSRAITACIIWLPPSLEKTQQLLSPSQILLIPFNKKCWDHQSQQYFSPCAGSCASDQWDQTSVAPAVPMLQDTAFCLVQHWLLPQS